MNHRTRKLTSLALCLLALAGCIPALVPTLEPVTITFVVPSPVIPLFGGGRAAYEELAEAFQEEHPYITVELLQRTPWQQDDISAQPNSIWGR